MSYIDRAKSTQNIGGAFLRATKERNWNLFAVRAPDKKGKKAKFPCKPSDPTRPLSIHLAAHMTFAEAVDMIEHYTIRKPQNLEKLNARARQYYKDEGEPYPGDVVELLIGYVAREGSALIVCDLDDVIDDEGDMSILWDGRIENCYAEISTGGRGVRVLMPREPGDLERFVSNVEIGGVGIFARGGKGAALTFQPLEGCETIDRNDELLEEIEKVRDVARNAARKVYEAGSSDAVEEFLEHGWTDPDKFERMLEDIPNDASIDFNQWYGLVMAAKEHFALQPDVDLDEIGQALARWSLNWESEDNDEDDSKFWELWDRPLGHSAGGRASMGSWHAMHREHAPEEPEETPPAVLEDDDDDEPFDMEAFHRRLQVKKVGNSSTVVASHENALRILRNYPSVRGMVAMNELNGSLLRLRSWETGEVLAHPVQWTDGDDSRVVSAVQSVKRNREDPFAVFGFDMIVRAIRGVAADRPFHPIRHEINRLPAWDGTPRLDTWIPQFLGVEDTPLHRAYARRFLISMIARGHATVENPVKVDTSLILTGAQGLNKSKFCALLAGRRDLFTDQIADLHTKDASGDILGVWVVELSEGYSVRKADQKHLKGFMARDVERYRPPYGRNTVSFPRTNVFVIPTNETTILTDATGSRRFWVLQLDGKIDLEGFAEIRDQLFAEAYAAYQAGEVWWLTADEESARRDLEDAFTIEDVWQERICEYLATRHEGEIVTVGDILEAIGREQSHANSADGLRIRDVMHKLNWQPWRTVIKRGYRRKHDSLPPMSEAARAAMSSGEVLHFDPRSEFSPINDGAEEK